MRANTLDAKQLEIDGQGASGGSNPNLLINGDFNVWQRGTSFASAGYTADRWYADGVTGVVKAATGDIPDVTFCNIISFSNTTTTYPYILQRIEGALARTIVGKTLTLSFWAKGTGTASFNAQFLYATAGDDFSTETLIESIPISGASEMATTWTKYEITTSTIPSAAANGLTVRFLRNNVAGVSTQIAQVKLEEGSIATPYVSRQPADELALCQWYYQYGTFGWSGQVFTSNGDARGNWHSFTQEMRTAPSVVVSVPTSNIFAQDADGGGAVNTYNISAQTVSTARYGITMAGIVCTPTLPSTDGLCHVCFRNGTFTADAEL